MRPVIALLTDFGTRDPYVAAVKGVILSACPDATLVDITHDISPYDTLEAALALETTCALYPPRTVFMAVVDPGVGSGRRGLAIAAGGRFYVGPDNGVLSLAVYRESAPEIHEIVQRDWLRAEIAPTFHARDVFAPVAARLATGNAIGDVGPLVDDPAQLAIPAVIHAQSHEYAAKVIHVDRFGNLITNVSDRQLEKMVGALPRESILVASVAGCVLPLVRTYSDVADGAGAMVAGGGGRLELAVRCGSAAERYGIGVGGDIYIRAMPSGGY
jgi:S-adenosylmethionine hydrolase